MTCPGSSLCKYNAVIKEQLLSVNVLLFTWRVYGRSIKRIYHELLKVLLLHLYYSFVVSLTDNSSVTHLVCPANGKNCIVTIVKKLRQVFIDTHRDDAMLGKTSAVHAAS